MTMPMPSHAADRAPRVNAGRLWAGGAATAAVAALVAIVGILLARGVFDLAVLAPEGEGVWGDADSWTYAACSAAAALLATGLVHLLILSTPSPLRFFRWVVTLVTLAAMLAPFAAERSWESVATALINLAIGITIGTLISSTARSATTTTPPGPLPPTP
ncbi:MULTISPECIES: DUF6069 family protein [unclassified Kribbella]|uniref:DUF6069 family protein n=1 Tax=unclassified Kribbella TaxID=2644121 RepID=UPI0033EED753